MVHMCPKIYIKHDSESLILTIIKDLLSNIKHKFNYIELDTQGSDNVLFLSVSYDDINWIEWSGKFVMNGALLIHYNPSKYGAIDNFDLTYPENTTKLIEFIRNKLITINYLNREIHPDVRKARREAIRTVMKG